ncbi:MAG: dihydrolipoamide acetyltransferase family protein [Bdellovibrionia bacterium]
MQFKLPELGEGVHEGELVKWRVKVGDQVKYDQPLCEIMTDKATVEIPSAFQGKVGELHVQEGKTVHVGQLMLSFEGQGSANAAAPEKASTPAAGATRSAVCATQEKVAPSPSPASVSVEAPSSPASRVLAAPSTRRVAREMGIDLSQVQGSGPHGRVMREDLTQSGSLPSSGLLLGSAGIQAGMRMGSVLGSEERVAFRGLRKKISEKMRLSKDHAAHFTYVEEADATQLVQLRNQAKEMASRQGVKLTYLPFVMKAMVAALRQYPILNSSLDEQKGELVYKHYYNIGLSVQTEDGLTAPVVKDVANKSVLEIAKEIQILVEKARSKRLSLEDLQGGTITLTNAGSIGGLFATPVINYPEVAILGLNKIFRKPVVKTISGQEQIVIRDWTYFSISLDHRVVDGAIGAEFMKAFIQMIENPSLLLLESF